MTSIELKIRTTIHTSEHNLKTITRELLEDIATEKLVQLEHLISFISTKNAIVLKDIIEPYHLNL